MDNELYKQLTDGWDLNLRKKCIECLNYSVNYIFVCVYIYIYIYIYIHIYIITVTVTYMVKTFRFGNIAPYLKYLDTGDC